MAKDSSLWRVSSGITRLCAAWSWARGASLTSRMSLMVALRASTASSHTVHSFSKKCCCAKMLLNVSSVMCSASSKNNSSIPISQILNDIRRFSSSNSIS
eukprot:2429659-Rhodomonas_salina.5